MTARRAAVLLAAAILTAAAPAAPPPAAIPYSRMDLPWWKARFQEKAEAMRHGPIDLVFYGDSITQDWEKSGPEPWRDFAPIWQHYYGNRHALNLGFKGDATAHLLWRLLHGEADTIHPKAAIVLIGANNFGHLHWPAEPTFRGIERIVDTIHQKLPATRVLLIGVLPSIRSPWVDANTAQLNALLRQRYADGRDATFLDLSRLFLTNGHIDPAKFLDPKLVPPDPPLHPSAQTQAQMAAAMEPWVSSVLGDKPRS
jgi:lysophospholipase L1-like esterase